MGNQHSLRQHSTYGFATPMDQGHARSKGYGYSRQKEPVQVIMQGGLNGNPANYAGGQPGFNHIVQPEMSASGMPVQGLVPQMMAGGFNPVPGYGENGPGYGVSGNMGGGFAPHGFPGPTQQVPMHAYNTGYSLQPMPQMAPAPQQLQPGFGPQSCY